MKISQAALFHYINLGENGYINHKSTSVKHPGLNTWQAPREHFDTLYFVFS